MLRRGAHLVRHPRLTAIFGSVLYNPNLWYLNRNSVAWAVSIGLFMSFMPLPSQMVFAAAAAIVIGCNLPIAVALVWISNPVTMPPIFYGAYKLGAWMMGRTPKNLRIELTVDWLLTRLGDIWQPFLLGCFVLGLGSALLGHLLVRLIWRLHVMASWRDRRTRRFDDPYRDED